MPTYAPIIAPSDLKTHIYAQIVDEITREDDEIAETAIDVAIEEVKTYLSKYDLDQIFGNATGDIASSFSNSFLTSLVKDVAVWQLITVAQPAVNFDMYRSRYEDAIDKLKQIQAGKSNPTGWPYLDTTGETAPTGRSVKSWGTRKRNNDY